MPSQKRQDTPQRSCLGCRQTLDKGSLLRFVLSPEGRVEPDIEARLPGRGAYTCINKSCLEKALKQRQFGRAFKQEVAAGTSQELTDRIAGVMRGRILGYIGLANRAGKVISGSSMVSDAVKSSHKPMLVIVATDISPVIGIRVEEQAGHHNVPFLRVLTKDDFGSILGKAPRSALAIKSSGFVRQLKNEIVRYRNFLGEVEHI